MSPVAADFASAERAPTEALVLVVDGAGAEDAGGGVEEAVEFEAPEDPQPALNPAASAEQRTIIAVRNMGPDDRRLT